MYFEFEGGVGGWGCDTRISNKIDIRIEKEKCIEERKVEVISCILHIVSRFSCRCEYLIFNSCEMKVFALNYTFVSDLRFDSLSKYTKHL